jgi:hypothetical protein
MTKKKNPEDKKTAGRKPVIDDVTLQKLENAFSLGATDGEACFQAGIAPATLYNYQNAHPEYVERKNQLKDRMIFKARSVIAEALNNKDKEVAKWYLERKAKNEFSTRQELTGQDGQNLIPVIEIQPVKASEE